MNVTNVEADHGTTERTLFAAFYGREHDLDNARWREMAIFSFFVLRSLEWPGLLFGSHDECEGKRIYHLLNRPLWRTAIKFDACHMLRHVCVH
jgi:hypothetical protein